MTSRPLSPVSLRLQQGVSWLKVPDRQVYVNLKSSTVRKFIPDADEFERQRNLAEEMAGWPGFPDFKGANGRKRYIDFKYVRGAMLSSELRSGSLFDTPDKKVFALYQIAVAIEHLHLRTAKKPSWAWYDGSDGNIICSKDGSIFLIDFGYSFPVEKPPPHFIGANVGTQGFKSPEQLLGKPELGLASDIYSFGLLAYKIMTGKSLFPVVPVRDERAEIWPLMAEGGVSRFFQGSGHRAVDDVILKCCSIEPRKRPCMYDVRKTLAELSRFAR